MQKRILSLILMVCLSLVCFVPSALGLGTEEDAAQNRIDFSDGSYVIITLEEEDAPALYATTSTKSGSKTYSYYDNSGNLDWKFRLSASFSYIPGVASSCTSSIGTVTIYNNAWYTISKSASKNGSTATGTALIGYKPAGITTGKKTVSLSLSCNSYGTLS